tara:strand:- start:2381 stop:2569 length:189 start_codon:yes stop_codon:yes gene_type:complete
MLPGAQEIGTGKYRDWLLHCHNPTSPVINASRASAEVTCSILTTVLLGRHRRSFQLRQQIKQ